ncbi:hypothetical protein DMH04_42045 [Kibdelosporangium aridum]|uniref:Uncharacterized protein n=1 Tax=Kibdelosporangium aridum TaxID=2030 RepID=A0A428YTL6_KIBAR|nr:hypothetical protein [Kibdelosporangium aridum]RSM72811.1 hypothetical protein DMH04_42045 [Kibdelosporangium aridum]
MLRRLAIVVVDLTAFPLAQLRSGTPAARVEAALSWAKAYAGGPDATTIQEQNQMAHPATG